MRRQGERKLFGGNAAAVIDDANQIASTVFESDVDAGGSCVDGIFDEFFDDACRSFDDLTSSRVAIARLCEWGLDFFKK